MSWTHQPWTTTEHGCDKATKEKTTILELKVTRLETLEVGSDEARNLRSCEQLKNMKIEVKIKETRWGKIRILD